MSDLISRKALLKALSKWDISKLYLVDSFKELVKEQPTAITEEEIEELKTLTGLQRKRTHYNRFVKEVFQKEKGSDLIYPDFDEIYKRYFELMEQRDKVVEQLEESYSCDVGTLQMISLDTAIEIVKGGAV